MILCFVFTAFVQRVCGWFVAFALR